MKPNNINALTFVVAVTTYFAVARKVTINWTATASALAVAAAGQVIRYRALLDLSREKQEGSENDKSAVISLLLARRRAGCSDEVKALATRGCGVSSEQYVSAACLVWAIPKFFEDRTASFTKQGFLAAGGIKKIYRAIGYVAGGDDTEKPERIDDWAWVETPTNSSKAVVRGYKICKKLGVHPNIHQTRRWRTVTDNAETKAVKLLVALEPLCPASLDQVRLPWRVMTGCIRQICEAVAFLHKHLVLHKDLKSSNIFLKLSKEGTIVPMIADFDVAMVLDSTDALVKGCSMAGSRLFLPPECFKKEGYGLKVDVWALSLLVYEQIWCAAEKRPRYPEFVRKVVNLKDDAKAGEALSRVTELEWPA